VKYPVIASLLGFSLFLSAPREVKPDSADLTDAQTVSYCEILNHPDGRQLEVPVSDKQNSRSNDN